MFPDEFEMTVILRDLALCQRDTLRKLLGTSQDSGQDVAVIVEAIYAAALDIDNSGYNTGLIASESINIAFNLLLTAREEFKLGPDLPGEYWEGIYSYLCSLPMYTRGQPRRKLAYPRLIRYIPILMKYPDIRWDMRSKDVYQMHSQVIDNLSKLMHIVAEESGHPIP